MAAHNSKRRQPGAATEKDISIVNKAVSGKLKAYYDEIAAQEVPDRFKDLLNKLDDAEGD